MVSCYLIGQFQFGKHSFCTLGADVGAEDNGGSTPLYSTALWGCPAAAQALIDAGDCVNHPCSNNSSTSSTVSTLSEGSSHQSCRNIWEENLQNKKIYKCIASFL